MKFTEHLGAHLTPEWRSQYIRYEVITGNKCEDLKLTGMSISMSSLFFLDQKKNETYLAFFLVFLHRLWYRQQYLSSF